MLAPQNKSLVAHISYSYYSAEMERLQMILDVDTGVDDAMALLLALRCPLVEVLAVTCVNGNSGVDDVVSNTLRVLDAAEAPLTCRVARGFDQPLVEPKRNCPGVHGQDGLGDLQPPLPPSTRAPSKEHAVQVILEALRAAPKPVTVVALAPLTNVAVAFRTEPGLWREKCARIVWMGGSVCAGGNATIWGEANAAGDPEAAHVVFTSGLPLLLYPWDVFLKVEYSRLELADFGIRENADKNLLKDAQVPSWSLLAGRLLHFLMRTFHSDRATIGDAGAVAAALLPHALTTRQLHVEMELHGRSTRGMTVCDLRPPANAVLEGNDAHAPPNASVVMDLDVGAMKALFTQHVFGGLPADGKTRARSRSRSRSKAA